MNSKPVIRDERTDAVAGYSARIAYLVLSLGLMIDVIVRSWAFRQHCLDLVGLYFVSSAVGLVPPLVKHAYTVPWRWVLWIVLLGMVAGAVSSLLPR